MISFFDIGKMLAGVAIFLLGMNFIEDAVRSLSGRKFKLFLKKQTSNKIKAIGGGALFTGLLQSSSIVNLLTLSMIGAGIIEMKNALAVMLGANLGTTFSSWLVATLGFSLNIESLAFPLAGVSGIVLTLFKTTSRWHQWSKFLLGLAFLFIGINFIKEAMEQIVSQTDLSSLNKYPVVIFFLSGILITAIIQSSSVTVALALSALYTDAISFYAATAIVLGSEIGTTLKLFLAAVNGTPIKKRVALGNFLFNVITTLVILIFLRPVNLLITDFLGIQSDLIGLVFFQSFTNIAGILFFYPLLNLMGRFLEKRFRTDKYESLYISKVNVSDTELALDAIEKETHHFISSVLIFSTGALDSDRGIEGDAVIEKEFLAKDTMERYEYIKHLHGEIQGIYMKLHTVSKSSQETERLEQLISCVRNGMYATKNIRDSLHDMVQLRNSSNDTKYRFYLQSRDKFGWFAGEVFSMINKQQNKGTATRIREIFENIQKGYTEILKELYQHEQPYRLNELEFSTLINFNRAMYTAFKSLVFAIKDYLLTPEEAKGFENIPGFIH